MENIYQKLLKTQKGVETPNYYEVLDFTPGSFRLSQLEDKYKNQLQKLQRVGNNPKYKEAILFLKGELRKARTTLEDPRSKHEYDTTLKRKTLEQIRNQVKLFALKKYITHQEKHYLQNISKKHAISWVDVDKLLKEQKLAMQPIEVSKNKKSLHKDLFYLSCILFLVVFYNHTYLISFLPVTSANNEARQNKQVSANTSKINKHESVKEQSKFLFNESNIPPEMVYIPAGDFYMGHDGEKDDEKPLRKVYLDAFYISKYEVTNKEYFGFIQETKRAIPYSTQAGSYELNWDPIEKIFPRNKENHPVALVSWDDAMAYCEWLSEKKQLHITLPTEAQWEKAARGSESLFQYPWEFFEKENKYYANYAAGSDLNLDGFSKTCPVYSFQKGCSPFGCFNMLGNVYEWCLDDYDSEAYTKLPNKNPIFSEDGNNQKVLRGGSWGSKISALRVSSRYSMDSKERSIYNGFRYVVIIK